MPNSKDNTKLSFFEYLKNAAVIIAILTALLAWFIYLEDK